MNLRHIQDNYGIINIAYPHELPEGGGANWSPHLNSSGTLIVLYSHVFHSKSCAELISIALSRVVHE